MVPLEESEPVNINTWEAMSASRPTRHGRRKRGGYPKEDEIALKVEKENQAFKLTYGSVEEAQKMQARLKARYGKGVRILTDESEPESLFIGPNDL